MAYDLKIAGGLIYDGDGGEPYVADIAVRDGVIVEIGRDLGPAAREIDASGLLVTPGFIDPHTHYDAQALWDTDLETSIRHGVTTAIGGNCGVGFAPLIPRDKANVISLMAGVEDIPSTVLSEGLAWNWSSFGDYLDRMADVPRPIDVGFNVPHDCVRLNVMGERAAAQEQATPEDIARMTEVLKESLLAGGVGFSFGRVFGHRTDDGRQTPSYNASHEELVALSGVLKDLPYRVLQGVTDGRIAEGPEAFDQEYQVVGKMVRAAGRPVSLNLHQRSKPEFSQTAWRKVMATADAVGDDLVRFQVNVKAVGSLYGLTSTLNLLDPFPTYRAIADRPLAERVAILKQPQTRAALLAETPQLLPEDPPKMAGVLRTLDDLEAGSERIYRMTEVPDCEPQQDQSLAHYAKDRGLSALAAYYDLCLEDDGRMLLEAPAMNYVDGNLDNLHEMLNHPGSFFGVGDAGAHLGYVCDVGYSTAAMRFWGADRGDRGHLPLAKVVNMLTGKVADHFGFTDRGRIKAGLRADLNVIDFDQMKLYRPRQVRDLPAGGQRFLQDAQGYRAVLVAGVAVLRDDAPTGAKPGKVLRAAAV